MSRYIDATDIAKQIADFKKVVNSPNSDYMTGYLCALSVTEGMIAETPTADVKEVRRGKWINNHCTVCGMTPIGEETWTSLDIAPPKYELWMSFCPCCGAKMEAKGERNERTLKEND